MVHLPTAISIFISILLLSFASLASAHSNLGYPIPYNFRSCRTASPWCKRRACPPFWPAKARNTRDRPAAVWKRGQRVTITWHKNNHIGGFYRRSIVPVDKMFDHKAHEMTAFDYGCWSQGTFTCTKDKIYCGGDAKKRAYKNEIQVPSVFPDGIYVFAQVWYGGLQWQGKYPNHSDYHACSFIHIRGGTPVTKSYAASWSGKDKKCATGSTKPGQCGGHCGDACGGPKCPKSAVKTTVPDEFRGGKAPTIILANFNPSAVAGTAPAQNAPAVAPVAPVAAPEAPGPMKSTTGPLKSVRVFVAHKMARELDDGETATVALNGGDVTFEAYTMGKKVGKVYFQINGVADKHVEMNPPYVFRGNKGAQYNIWPKSQAILNRQFKLTITLQDGTQKYEKSVMLTLTN